MKTQKVRGQHYKGEIEECVRIQVVILLILRLHFLRVVLLSSRVLYMWIFCYRKERNNQEIGGQHQNDGVEEYGRRPHESSKVKRDRKLDTNFTFYYKTDMEWRFDANVCNIHIIYLGRFFFLAEMYFISFTPLCVSVLDTWSSPLLTFQHSYCSLISGFIYSC